MSTTVTVITRYQNYKSFNTFILEMLNYTGTEVMYVFKKNVLQTEMADCKLFAMCSASSPCMLLQARKSMRLEVDASNM